ncbi:pilus assembly protein [Gammaproteobacteria bacterium 45_16_T64]|nr:pilus assembly protein [Gammaproteobacteria bacterium 45_16_T64]
MHILSRDSLTLGGFAGLREHRIVTDSQLFGGRKKPEASEGLGNFVYLADAKFNPKGETGMHPHKEIDVITVMIKGRVSHEGSLEHGRSLDEGAVQVQRAGGEGFAHNEINPDDQRNRLIQLWALPEHAGEPAGYKYYQPQADDITQIYGGDKTQDDTFDSHTTIDIVRLAAGKRLQLAGEQLSYVTDGTAEFNEGDTPYVAGDGDLIRSHDVEIHATSDVDIIVISKK